MVLWARTTSMNSVVHTGRALCSIALPQSFQIRTDLCFCDVLRRNLMLSFDSYLAWCTFNHLKSHLHKNSIEQLYSYLRDTCKHRNCILFSTACSFCWRCIIFSLITKSRKRVVIRLRDLVRHLEAHSLGQKSTSQYRMTWRRNVLLKWCESALPMRNHMKRFPDVSLVCYISGNGMGILVVRFSSKFQCFFFHARSCIIGFMFVQLNDLLCALLPRVCHMRQWFNRCVYARFSPEFLIAPWNKISQTTKQSFESHF